MLRSLPPTNNPGLLYVKLILTLFTNTKWPAPLNSHLCLFFFFDAALILPLSDLMRDLLQSQWFLMRVLGFLDVSSLRTGTERNDNESPPRNSA